jgi:chorismate synthase
MPAPYERSDICAVPAVSVVSECVVGFEIAKAFLEKFGADTFEEIRTRHQRYKNELIRRGKRVQK